jgi:tripartite-type tricarboxylate transporter receptor subunit TctC
MRTALMACVAAAAFGMPPVVSGQSFPSKPVRIIIPNPPGVPNDIMARGLSQYLTPRIGQPLVVENRPGGEGVIGMEACARSSPDGHSMCFAAQGAIVASAFLRSNLPYDPVRDFAPIIHMGYFDSGLVVHPSVTARSFNELVESAKAKPDAVSWGVFSFHSSGNFYAEWLRKMRDVHFLVVPYKAPTQMLQALLTGEVQSGVSSLGTIAKHVQSGKLRLLAVTTDERHPGFPNVPTFAEIGLNLPVRSWAGIVGPAGMPRDVVQWLNTEFGKVAASPEFRDRILAPQGVMFSANTADEFAAYLRRNRDGFAQLLKIVPIKPE